MLESTDTTDDDTHRPSSRAKCGLLIVIRSENADVFSAGIKKVVKG